MAGGKREGQDILLLSRNAIHGSRANFSLQAYNVNLVTDDCQEEIRPFNEKCHPRWQGY